MHPILSIRLAMFLPLAMLGCESRTTRPAVHRASDAEPPSAQDVVREDVPDAMGDVGPPSARDVVSEDIPDATVADVSYSPCVEEIQGGTCWYQGYGTTCELQCNVEPTCTFRVSVTWQGGNYCCLVSPPGGGREVFYNCSCIEGRVLCRTSAPEDSSRIPPTSFCEFCDRVPGSDRDR